MRALEYALKEALASLWRGGQSGVLSTLTIALALIVFGAFLLVTSNLQRLGASWASAAEMSVYLDDGVTADQRAAIERQLAPSPMVASREFVSKPTALKRFKETFSDLSTVVDSLNDNPLPASYEVRLGNTPAAGSSVESLATRLRETPGVVDVRYDRQWLNRLSTATKVLAAIGLVLGSVLTLAAALTVANVVRLALNARRDELSIMQLVGAPQVYVRGPFVMEGILQGGAGGGLALAALAGGFFLLRARYFVPLASSIDLPAIRFLPLELCVLLVLGGMVVGCLGGLVAAWAD
jgi:cell division transport system permease protein